MSEGYIHNYEKKLKKELKDIGEMDNKSNKRILLTFKNELEDRMVKIPRVLKYLGSLRYLVEKYGLKDLQKAKKKDIENTVQRLRRGKNQRGERLAAATIYDYLITLKVFYKWLRKTDTPKELSGLKQIAKDYLKLTKKDTPSEKDMITPKEAQALIDAAGNSRDKCLLALLWELGARVNGLGMLNIEDLTVKSYGYLVSVNDKSGRRDVPVMEAVPYIQRWLSEHPLKGDKDPLFVQMDGRDRLKRISYPAITAVVSRCGKLTNIKRKTNPHNFRASRATHDSKFMAGPLVEAKFGWRPGSRHAARYIGLGPKALEDAIRKQHGEGDPEPEPEVKMPRVCPRCKIQNAYDNKFCEKCLMPLDYEGAMSITDKDGAIRQLNDAMIILTKKIEDLQTKKR